MTTQHAVKVFDASGFESAAQRLVLLELAYRADRKGVVRYSQSEIAEVTTLARPTVARHFRRFEETGLLERQGHGRYLLNMEPFDWPEGPAALFAQPRIAAAHPGAEEELARLREIREPHQGITYDASGWPRLQSM